MVLIEIVMKLTLSTIGCPGWTLDEVCGYAQDYDFDGIDFRGLLDEVDITQTRQFTDDIEEARARLDKTDLPVSALSSSISICNPDDTEENLTAAERYVDLAMELDVPYVRVFGNGDTDTYSRSELVDIGSETMESILSLPSADDVTWLIETHDNWTSSDDCRLLSEQLPDEVGVLWDIGHTSRVGREDPAETWMTLGDEVEYIHLKDAVYNPSHPKAMDDGWRYVLPGDGQLPLAEGLDLLDERGYDGWMMYEHEKRWHPELADPEVAYPAFIEWFKSTQ